MRKTIYLAICERLKEQAPAIEHISLWNENITDLEKESGYCLPAVFVEFEPINWKQGGHGSKTATLRTRLHIVVETLADPSDGSHYQRDALKPFDTINSVVYAVTGLSGMGFNRFQNIESRTDHNHDRIQHHIEGFTCEIFDSFRSDRRKHGKRVELKIMPEMQSNGTNQTTSQKMYKVILVNCGTSKLNTVKELLKLPDFTLKKCKELTDNLPAVLATELDYGTAENWKNAILGGSPDATVLIERE